MVREGGSFENLERLGGGELREDHPWDQPHDQFKPCGFKKGKKRKLILEIDDHPGKCQSVSGPSA